MDFNKVPNYFYRGSQLELPSRRKVSNENSKGNPMNSQGFKPCQNYSENMANGNPMHKMDMEATSNNGSSENHSSSNHPTPSTTSNKSSSRTSYSPPQLDETTASQYLSNMANVPSPNTAAFFDSRNTFGGYSPGTQNILTSLPDQDVGGSFAVASGWEFQSGQTGLTPDNRTEIPPSLPTGMNQLEESGWVNMLNDFGWDPLVGVPDPLSRDRESH